MTATTATQTSKYQTVNIPREFEGALDDLVKSANRDRPEGAPRVAKGPLLGAIVSALSCCPALAQQVLAASRDGDAPSSVSLTCEEHDAVRAAFQTVAPDRGHGLVGQVNVSVEHCGDVTEQGRIAARVTRSAIVIRCACCLATRTLRRTGTGIKALAKDAARAAALRASVRGQVCTLPADVQ